MEKKKEIMVHTKTKTVAFMNRKKRHFLPPGSEVAGNWYPKYIIVPNKDTGEKYGPYLVLVRRTREDGTKQQVYVGMKGHKVTWAELATINEVWGGENDYIPTGADIRFILE